MNDTASIEAVFVLIIRVHIGNVIELEMYLRM